VLAEREHSDFVFKLGCNGRFVAAMRFFSSTDYWRSAAASDVGARAVTLTKSLRIEAHMLSLADEEGRKT
jgi:hypothetical protein